MGKLIEISAKTREAIPVRLVGKDYTLTTPKSYLAMMMAIRAKNVEQDPEKMMDAINEWLEGAFGKATSKAILKRLQDPADALDFPQITELMQAVMEMGTEDPTT